MHTPPPSAGLAGFIKVTRLAASFTQILQDSSALFMHSILTPHASCLVSLLSECGSDPMEAGLGFHPRQIPVN